MTGRTVAFEMPLVTQTLNQILRMHWSKRRLYQRNLAWSIRAALGANWPPRTMARADVTIERHAIREPDLDNLIGGAKTLIDCLLPLSERHPTGLGLVADDSPDRMRLTVRSVRVKHRAEQKTTVSIVEIAG